MTHNIRLRLKKIEFQKKDLVKKNQSSIKKKTEVVQVNFTYSLSG